MSGGNSTQHPRYADLSFTCLSNVLAAAMALCDDQQVCWMLSQKGKVFVDI